VDHRVEPDLSLPQAEHRSSAATTGHQPTASPQPLGGGASPFAADDGAVPEALAALLAGWAAGRAHLGEVVAELARSRVLVPLLEVDAGQLEGDDADPCAGQDRAVAAVSLRAEEGQVGLAFTGMGPMLAWHAAARPLPEQAPRVAAALLAQEGAALLVDPAGPHPLRLTGVALRRLAAGEPWPEPWADPSVQAAVVAVLAPALAAGDVAVRLARGEERVPGPEDSGEPSGTRSAALAVELRFAGQVPPTRASARAEVVAERLAGSAQLREVFDGTLEVRVV
jgi:hypothetical protein